MPNSFAHEPYCEQNRAAIELYIRLWPKFCRHCGGWGMINYPATRMEPGSSDPCPECNDKGYCPRCGTDNVDFKEHGMCDYLMCNNCGWDEYRLLEVVGAEVDMVCPEQEPCMCGYTKDYEKMMEDIANAE